MDIQENAPDLLSRLGLQLCGRLNREERILRASANSRKLPYLGHVLRRNTVSHSKVKIEGRRDIGRKQFSWLRNNKGEGDREAIASRSDPLRSARHLKKKVRQVLPKLLTLTPHLNRIKASYVRTNFN